MVKLPRLALLSTSLVYLMLCLMAGLELNGTLHGTMVALFIVFGGIVGIRYLVLLVAAILEKSKTGKETTSWRPNISIIIPAFNEENDIRASLISLATLEYPNYEIILVDDGSSDGTLCAAQLVTRTYPEIPIRILSQSNSGKSAALNTGIMHAHGDLIVCVDSDSRLDKNALTVGVSHFLDPQVAAVGGFVEVANQNYLITKLQQLEYLIGLNFVRRGLSFFDIVTIVPGPISMFRKDALLQAGVYNTRSDCFAEDADLTVRLLAAGWKVKGETRMVAYTEAPETIFNLLRQRYRWKRGVFQAFFDNHYKLITAPTSSGIFIAGILAFESFVFDILNFGITLFSLASFLKFGEFKFFIWIIMFYTFLDLVVLVFSNYGRGALFKTIWLFMLQKISYAYILQAWNVFALFDEWLSAHMSWDKLKRTGGLDLGGS